MTIHVRESSSGRDIERAIDLGIMVFPGALVPHQNAPPPGRRPDKLLAARDLAEAAFVIERQIRQLWGPFSVEEDGVTFRYRVELRVRTTDDLTPVCRWANDPDRGPMGVPEDGTRPITAAFAEAASTQSPNIAVVHRRIVGNPCAPFFDGSGAAADVSQSRESPGVLIRASNLVTLSYVQLREPGNRTAAHEAGHLFGMADFGYIGDDIMSRPGLHPRSMQTARDRERLHDVLEASPPGVEWRGDRVRRRGASPRLPRRSRRATRGGH